MHLLPILNASRDTLLLPHREPGKCCQVARPFFCFRDPMLLLNSNRAIGLFAIWVQDARARVCHSRMGISDGK